MKTYKCRYAHCFHETTDVSEDECVKVGRLYYHKDCAEHRDKVNQVITIFYEQINPNVIGSQLRNVVNNIVYKKRIDIDFLLWGIQKWVDKLNYPQGLYYLIQDKQLADEWKRLKSIKHASETKKEEVKIVEDNHSFTWKPEKEKSLGDLFD